MPSIRYLYRIGRGPSSSHTMAPEHAARMFRERNPKAHQYEVTLYGSLASTGIGHMTDVVITDVLGNDRTKIVLGTSSKKPKFPAIMCFEALEKNGDPIDSWTVASIGGGTLCDMEGKIIGDEAKPVYPVTTMASILEYVKKEDITLSQYVERCEGIEIWDHLKTVWFAMETTIQRGLDARGLLPGPLNKGRRAASYYDLVAGHQPGSRDSDIMHNLLSAYALACSEENAAGGTVVTAPTCGASGVVPSIAKFFHMEREASVTKILNGLATAGLIGNLAKYNASILGAEVGCQGEVGVAISMAAAMATQFKGGTPQQIEYAAEMGIEHRNGLTCDPVKGLVQIPCIERNALGATDAYAVANLAMGSNGEHMISYDMALRTMKKTGKDLQAKYKETSQGGLAEEFDKG